MLAVLSWYLQNKLRGGTTAREGMEGGRPWRGELLTFFHSPIQTNARAARRPDRWPTGLLTQHTKEEK